MAGVVGHRKSIYRSFLLVWLVTQFIPVVNSSCHNVEQIQSACLQSGVSATVDVACPAYFAVRVTSAVVYRTPDSASACSALSTPPTDPGSACQEQDVTSSATGAGQGCAYSASATSCSYTVAGPTAAGSAGSCSGPDYFVLTRYRCEPVYNAGTSGEISTGTAVSMMDTASVVVNTGIAVSPEFGFHSSSPDTCLLYIPPKVEAIGYASAFNKLPSTISDCSTGRVEVYEDGTTASIATFCNVSSPTVSLGCSLTSTGRYLRVEFKNDVSSVRSFFSIRFTVPTCAFISAQCVSATAPLSSVNTTVTCRDDETTTAAETTTDSPTTTTPALSPTTTTTTSIPSSTTTTPVLSPTTTTTTSIPSSKTTTPVPSPTTTTATTTTSSGPPNIVQDSSTTTADVGATDDGQSGGAEKSDAKSGWNDSATIGVVVGCGIAAIIIIGAILAACCYRWRQSSTAAADPYYTTRRVFEQQQQPTMIVQAKPNDRPPTRPADVNYQLDATDRSTSPYRNVTEFYVDGNSTSKLVLNRQQEPKIFKTVLRV